MGVSKVILNNSTLIDVTQKTVMPSNLLSPNTALDAAGSDVVGAIATKTAANLSASGSVVTVPSGYYAANVSKAISGGTATTPAKTINVTPTVSLNSSTGVVSIGITGSSSITPTITAGYISSGTAGTVSVSGSSTFNLTTKAAATYTPTTTNQTIASNQYLIGTQTIAGDSNLIADNIAKDVAIFGITGTHEGGVEVDDMIFVGNHGIYFQNFDIENNVLISEKGTVSGNTLVLT